MRTMVVVRCWACNELLGRVDLPPRGHPPAIIVSLGNVQMPSDTSQSFAVGSFVAGVASITCRCGQINAFSELDVKKAVRNSARQFRQQTLRGRAPD